MIRSKKVWVFVTGNPFQSSLINHLSLLGQFVNYEENEVLWIRPLIPKTGSFSDSEWKNLIMGISVEWDLLENTNHLKASCTSHHILSLLQPVIKLYSETDARAILDLGPNSLCNLCKARVVVSDRPFQQSVMFAIRPWAFPWGALLR
jgi:hypothetical protein